MQLTVPGNVELKSGAFVVRREVHEDRKETEFELIPPPGPISLVMSLNSHILRRDRVMVARSVVLDEIAAGVERVHVTSTFSILHGATDRVEFRLPAQFEVVQVATESLSRWSAAPDVEGQQKLTVVLRQPATEPVTVTLSAVRFSRDDKNWSFPAVLPLDVEGQVSVVGLLMEQGWRVEHVTTEGLIAIDRDVLGRTINAEQLARDVGAPPIRPVLAFYAPQASYQLSAQFEKPPQRLEVVTSLLLNVDEKGHEISGAFSLRPQVERLFQVTFTAPANWKITALRDAAGNALAFEIYQGDGGAQRVAVRLPQAVAPQTSFTIAFTARGNVEGWLGEWTETTFDFPVFQVEGADVDRGAIAILAFSDLEVRPQQLNDLSPLNNDEKAQYGLAQQTDLAFRYDAQPYSATFHVGRRQPSATAQTFSFLKVGKEGLEAYYEIFFSIREATTRRVRVSLPEDTPSELTITGLGGTVVKEYTSSVEDGKRNWLILLSDNVPLNADREGAAAIAISFQKTLPDEARELPLPIVKALGVEYQTGVVAVEGDAELEVEVSTDARKGNVSDLAQSPHQPGKRLLGTYSFVGDPSPITVDVFRRGAHPLPPAIAEKAELWTAVSVNGRGQTLARFHLRTKALLLEARLPPNAELWSIVLDDQSITPQRDGDTVLINLPTSNNRAVRVLDIVFEVPLKLVGIWDSVDTSAPHLYLPSSEAEEDDAEVPVADLQWKLLLPKGYSVTYTGGTVQWKNPPARPSLWDVVGAYMPRAYERGAMAFKLPGSSFLIVDQ
jgi:hypothetical protein